MLRPEDWEKFRQNPSSHTISYRHTTYRWAKSRGWIKNEGLFAMLYALLAAVCVLAVFWLAEELFGLSRYYLLFAVPLALVIGALRGSDRAFKRSFVAKLISSEQSFHDALMGSGIDIYAPGEFQ